MYIWSKWETRIQTLFIHAIETVCSHGGRSGAALCSIQTNRRRRCHQPVCCRAPYLCGCDCMRVCCCGCLARIIVGLNRYRRPTHKTCFRTFLPHVRYVRMHTHALIAAIHALSVCRTSPIVCTVPGVGRLLHKIARRVIHRCLVLYRPIGPVCCSFHAFVGRPHEPTPPIDRRSLAWRYFSPTSSPVPRVMTV